MHSITISTEKNNTMKGMRNYVKKSYLDSTDIKRGTTTLVGLGSSRHQAVH